MCEMASFIITPSSVLWHPKSDSHADILEKYGIEDDYDKPDFVKVEIFPLNNNYKLPIEKWEYSVDSDQKYFPEWYNSVEAEKACRLELKHWYVEKVIKKGTHTFSGKVNKIIIGGDITINNLEDGSEIWVYGKSKVEINNMNGGFIELNNKSTLIIINKDGGDVRIIDNSTANIKNNSYGSLYFFKNSSGEINNISNGYIDFYENSNGTINKQCGGFITSWDKSSVNIIKKNGGEFRNYND